MATGSNGQLVRAPRRQRHGGDLMAYVKALARQYAARFLVDRCKLRRVDTEGVVRSQRNLMLECMLPWVTAKPGAATEKKP